MNQTKSIYGKLNIEPHWYALKTRNRHEKKVNERLQQKGVTSYLPLFSTYHLWSDRKKKVIEPLFSCYVFVKIALKDRLPVLQTDGAVRLVGFNNIPVPIPENQIDSVRQVLQEKISFKKVDYLTVGQKVEVICGPLKGISGYIQRIKKKPTLIIGIDVIQQAVSVVIDGDSIKVID